MRSVGRVEPFVSIGVGLMLIMFVVLGMKVAKRRRKKYKSIT